MWLATPIFGQLASSAPFRPPSNTEQSKSQGYRARQFLATGSTKLVTEVRVIGNRTVPEARVRSYLKTRPERIFDPEGVQADVRSLAASGLFHDVRTYKESDGEGVRVSFEVFERPTIQYIRFVGNDKLTGRKLVKKIGIKVGDPLHSYSVEEAKSKLEEMYLQAGFSQIQVEVTEGNKATDAGVIFTIHEGPLQRIWKTKFVGNAFVSSRVLKTKVQSKPGILWYFKGKVDREKIEQDVQTLTAYYRRFGFFAARISREVEFNEAGNWATITYVIDEGPRYKIRDVSIVGCQKFDVTDISQRLGLRSGEFFNLDRMNRDVTTLRDLYGSQGYIYADVKADPRFLEEPGGLDLAYDIEEGDQYRVGKINVKIDGEMPHTRHSVVYNRISLRPGDIIDTREVRASERRLKASQLFLNDPARGASPRIVVKPPELSDISRLADRRTNSPTH